MSIEALKHALETLEEVQMAITTSSWMNRRIEELRAAIEQAEKQEPVAFLVFCDGEIISAQTSKLELPYGSGGSPVIPVYAAPLQREWQGLTDEEHGQIAIDCGCATADWVFYGAAVERKLKEKNGFA